MKPYGLKPKFHDNGLKDKRPHPKHSYVNWWETKEINKIINKGGVRRHIKREVQDET